MQIPVKWTGNRAVRRRKEPAGSLPMSMLPRPRQGPSSRLRDVGSTILHTVMTSCSVPLTSNRHGAKRSCAIVAPLLLLDNPNAQLDTERRRSPSQVDQIEIVPFASRRAPTTFVTGRLRVSPHGPFEMRAQESGSPTGRSGELNQILSANSVSALPPSRFRVHIGSSPLALGVS